MTVGHILQFEEQGPCNDASYPGSPVELVANGKEAFGREPSLIFLSMGLRYICEGYSLSRYGPGVVRLVQQLRAAYPEAEVVVIPMGASHDELRSGGFATTQGQRSIVAHNLALLQALQGHDVPVLDIMEVQAQPVTAAATADGIHFLVGTGVNEAVAQVILNRLC